MGERNRDTEMEQARASGKISFSRSGSLTQQGGVLIERISLDVFVRYPAFLEGYPAFLRKWAELSGRGCEYQAGSVQARKMLPSHRTGQARSRLGGF